MPLFPRTSELILHVKWFVDEETLGDHPLTAPEILFACLMISAGVWIFANVHGLPQVQMLNQALDSRLSTYRQIVPLVVRISTFLMVFINIYHGYLLAPNVESDDTALSVLITILFSATAIMVGVGYLTRIGAGLFLATYFLVLAKANSWVDVVDHFEYVGVAGYLWYRGPGRISLDGYLKIGRPIPPEHLNKALDVYRISVGFGLVILGFSEKLMNVAASQQFLDRFNWNIMEPFGIGDQMFIIAAGSIEVAIGLALLLNLTPRLVTLIVLGTMTVTAAVLGPEEIYGHIFAVGIVLAIWVNDRVVLESGVTPAEYQRIHSQGGLGTLQLWLRERFPSVLATYRPLPQPSIPEPEPPVHDATYQLQVNVPEVPSTPATQWNAQDLARGRVVGMLELKFGRDNRITDLLVNHLAEYDPEHVVWIIGQHHTLEDLLFWLSNPPNAQSQQPHYRPDIPADGV